MHRLVHAQGFGQRLGGFWRAHILHRIGGDQPFAAQPGVKAAPARQDQRNAAAAAPGAVHLHDPAPHVGAVHLRQRHTGLQRIGLQLVQVQCVELHGALGQAFFHPHMLQVTLDQRMRCGRS